MSKGTGGRGSKGIRPERQRDGSIVVLFALPGLIIVVAILILGGWAR